MELSASSSLIASIDEILNRCENPTSVDYRTPITCCQNRTESRNIKESRTRKWNPFGADGKLTYPPLDYVKTRTEEMQRKASVKQKLSSAKYENIISLKDLSDVSRSKGMKREAEFSSKKTKRTRKISSAKSFHTDVSCLPRICSIDIKQLDSTLLLSTLFKCREIIFRLIGRVFLIMVLSYDERCAIRKFTKTIIFVRSWDGKKPICQGPSRVNGTKCCQ